MIRFVTDSAADLTPREREAEGLVIVPMAITFEDDKTIEDDGSMSRDEFYEKLAGCSKLPRTSQPSPESFMNAFRDARDAGDEVVAITISQALSGTYQCAVLAAEDVGGEVHIVDSRAATQCEAILVREALRLRDEGCCAAEIAAALNELRERVRITAVVDSLHHLHKGGRLPAAVAIMGGALGIKPVVALQDGKIKMLDKGRGRPGALVALFKQIEKLGGIDPAYGYTMVYTDDRRLTAPIHHYLHDTMHLTGARIAQVGPTIGTHIGPGAVGVAFVARQ